jgi:hypothetical protein
MGYAVVAAQMTDQKNGLPLNYMYNYYLFKGRQDLKGKKKKKTSSTSFYKIKKTNKKNH